MTHTHTHLGMEKCSKSQLYLLLAVIVVVLVRSGEGQLSVNYYNSTCPNVEAIVLGAVKLKLKQTKFKIPIPATLRLFFHDCFVEGCDASILVDSPSHDAEKDASENLPLAGDGFDTVIKAKEAVEKACPGIVSCADILAIATKVVIFLAGGPNYTVETGRLDGLVSNITLVSGKLPKADFNLSQLNNMFSKHNLSQTDMIALSGGAHTVGFSHCSQFSNRLYSFNATYKTDPTLNTTYAKRLKRTCPDKDVGEFFDPITPNKFDNAYYKNLKDGKGLLSSDQVLFTDKASRNEVLDFAEKPDHFNTAFIVAMQKLGRVGVKTKIGLGKIRKDCTKI